VPALIKEWDSRVIEAARIQPGDKVLGIACGTSIVARTAAQRIMSLAGLGEVWLSSPTVALLEGSGLAFSDAGEHGLKGFEVTRRLYRLIEE
jgi:ubiquinone/menaquinone biosynthesis C-methylase UbiE